MSATKKSVVGVMSALPVLGRSLNPLSKQQPTEPWVIGSELKRLFDVRKVEIDAKKIDDDIKVLLVIHPRNVMEDTEYAIDQFVLRGGKLIVFVDPYAYFDQQPDMQNPFGGAQAGQSALYNLFKAWGFELTLNQVVADLTYASGAGPRLLPTLLSLPAEALNQDDVVMSQVGTLLIPFGGRLQRQARGRAHPDRARAQLEELDAGGSHHRDAFGRAVDAGLPAFRRGIHARHAPLRQVQERVPQRQARADGAGRDEKKPEPPKDEKHLREAAADNQIVLVSDVDMLTDGAAVEVQDVFGQKLVVPRNGNLAFAQGLVEQFSGDQNLMGLRSRASFTRPLTVIRTMEAQAQQQYLGKIKELEDNLNQTQEKLQELQKGKRRRRQRARSSRPSSRPRSTTSGRKRSRRARELKDVRKNLRRRNRPAGVLDQGRQHRARAAAGRADRPRARVRQAAARRGCGAQQLKALEPMRMNRKQFLLLVLALVVLGGAGIALFWQNLDDYRASGAKIGAKLMPGLKVADVAQVELRDAKNKVDARAQGKLLGGAGAREAIRRTSRRSAISSSSSPT